MTNNRAFTLVELLITVSILATISIVWISSFQTFFSKEEDKTIAKNVISIIKRLDSEVLNSRISQYRLEFAIWSKFIKWDINNANNKYKINTKEYNHTTMTGVLNTNNASSEPWNIYILANWMIKETWNRSWSGESLNIDISKYNLSNTIEIYSNINKEITNKITFYNLNSLKDVEENSIPVSIENFSWSVNMDSKLFIKNVIWKKNYYIVTPWFPPVYISWSTLIFTRWNNDISLELK